MGLLDKINAALDASIAKNTAALTGGKSLPHWMPTPTVGTPAPLHRAPGARPLGADEIESFMAAAEERPGIYARPRSRCTTRESFLKEVRMTNPLRFRRLEKDVQWLRRQAKRAGLDPDEVRWML